MISADVNKHIFVAYLLLLLLHFIAMHSNRLKTIKKNRTKNPSIHFTIDADVARCITDAYLILVCLILMLFHGSIVMCRNCGSLCQQSGLILLVGTFRRKWKIENVGKEQDQPNLYIRRVCAATNAIVYSNRER